MLVGANCKTNEEVTREKKGKVARTAFSLSGEIDPALKDSNRPKTLACSGLIAPPEARYRG